MESAGSEAESVTPTPRYNSSKKGWVKQAWKLGLIRSRVQQRKLEAGTSGSVSDTSVPAAHTNNSPDTSVTAALTFSGAGVTFHLDFGRCCGHGVGGTADEPWYFLVAGRERRGIAGGYGLTLVGCQSSKSETLHTLNKMPTGGGLECGGNVRLAVVLDVEAGTLTGRQEPSGRLITFATQSDELASSSVAPLKAACDAAKVERDQAREVLAEQMIDGGFESLCSCMRHFVAVTNAAAPMGGSNGEDREDVQRLAEARARLAALVNTGVVEGGPGWREKRALLELKPFVLGFAPDITERSWFTDTWRMSASLDAFTDHWGPLKMGPSSVASHSNESAVSSMNRISPTSTSNGSSPTTVTASSSGEDRKEEDEPLTTYGRHGMSQWKVPPQSDPIAVRGPNYLRDKKKYDSPAPYFPLLGLDLFRCPTKKDGGAGPMERICAHPRSLCQRALRPGVIPLPAAVDPEVAELVRLPPDEASSTHGGFEPTVCLTPPLEEPEEGSVEALEAATAKAYGLTAGQMPEDEAIPDQHVLAFNFMLPVGNFVAYFVRPPEALGDENEGGSDAHLRKLYDAFIRGDDDFRRKRLKMLSRLVEAPWIVKVAVGKGKKPAILSKHIEMHFTRGKNHMEVTLNVAKSQLGANILKVLLPASTKVEVDLAFILEGVSDAELPERTLAAVRITRPDVVHAPLLWSTTNNGQPLSTSKDVEKKKLDEEENVVAAEAPVTAVESADAMEKEAVKEAEVGASDTPSSSTPDNTLSEPTTLRITPKGHERAPSQPLEAVLSPPSAPTREADVVVELDLTNAAVVLEASELAALLSRLPHLKVLRVSDNERLCGDLGTGNRAFESPYRDSMLRKKPSDMSFGVRVGISWKNAPGNNGSPRGTQRQGSGSSLVRQLSSSGKNGSGSRLLVSFREPRAEAKHWQVLLRAFHEKAEKEDDAKMAAEVKSQMLETTKDSNDKSDKQSTQDEARDLAEAAGVCVSPDQSLRLRLTVADSFDPALLVANDDDSSFLKGMPLAGVVTSHEISVKYSRSSRNVTNSISVANASTTAKASGKNVYFLYFAPPDSLSEFVCVLKFGTSPPRTRAELLLNGVAASLGVATPSTTLLTREGATAASWRALEAEASALEGATAVTLAARLSEGRSTGTALLMEFVPGKKALREDGSSDNRTEMTVMSLSVAEELGAVFVLDLVVENCDRFPCAALNWQGNADNLIASSSGRVFAIDTILPKVSPSAEAAKQSSDACSSVVELVLGDDATATAALLRELSGGQSIDDSACESFRQGFRAALVRLEDLEEDLLVAQKALCMALAQCSEGAATCLRDSETAASMPPPPPASSSPPPSPPSSSPSCSSQATLSIAENTPPPGTSPPASPGSEVPEYEASDGFDEEPPTEIRGTSLDPSRGTTTTTAPIRRSSRLMSAFRRRRSSRAVRLSASASPSKRADASEDAETVVVNRGRLLDVRAIHSRYMSGSATQIECDFVSEWRQKVSALSWSWCPT